MATRGVRKAGPGRRGNGDRSGGGGCHQHSQNALSSVFMTSSCPTAAAMVPLLSAICCYLTLAADDGAADGVSVSSMSGCHSAPAIRFLSLSSAAADLIVKEDGAVVTRTSRSHDLRIVYLSRPIAAHQPPVRLSVHWIPNQRNTLTIAIGTTSCPASTIGSQPQFHARHYCQPDDCPSAGRSLVALIGVPGAGAEESRHVPGLICIQRLSAHVLSISVNGRDFELCAQSDAISFAKSTPFLILTPDIKSIRIVTPDATPDATPVRLPVPAAVVSEVLSACSGPANGSLTSDLKRMVRITPVRQDDHPIESEMDEFVLPIDSDNLQASEDNKVITRKSLLFVRNKNIAHLNRALAVGHKLVLHVGKTTFQMQNSASFQLGFTLCDLTTVVKIETHRQSCGKNPDKVCLNSFAQSIAPFASNGAVIIIERSDKSIDVIVTRNGVTKSYPMKFCNATTKEGASFISPTRVYYPFVVLNGNTDVLKILSNEETPLPASVRPNNVTSDSVENGDQMRRLSLVSQTGSERGIPDFRFMNTTYANPSIVISADGRRVQTTSVPGKKIVFFNRKMDIGQGLVLRTLASSGPRLKYSYMFGATTCNKSNILVDEGHVRALCSEKMDCRGKSVTSELWNCSQPTDYVTVERGGEQFVVDVSNGKSRKRYLKWIPNSRVETLDWYPFLILDAEVDAVEITNEMPSSRRGSGSSPLVRGPRPRTEGMMETADNLVHSLEERPLPATSKSAGNNSPASLQQSRSVSQNPIQTAYVDYHFLKTSYPLDNIEIKMDRKQAERKSKSGARIVYLDDELVNGAIVALKIMSDNLFLHQKAHTFTFGLTTCNKKAIVGYASHGKEVCGSSSPCGGSSCLQSVSDTAHAGSIVYFQRKLDVVEITIRSPSARSIEIMRIPAEMTASPVYPFIQLSGNADAVLITDAALTAESFAEKTSRPSSRLAMSLPPAETQSPAAAWNLMESLSASAANGGQAGDGNAGVGIGFLALPYRGNAIQFLDNNQKVRRNGRTGSIPIFLSQEIEVGMSVVLTAEASNEPPAGIRFEFGFTSCTRDAIMQQQCHMVDICSRGPCSGQSHTVGMRYNAKIVSSVTVTRSPECFFFDIGRGADHKRFAKHFPEGVRGAAFHWMPFIRLNGDAQSVEVTASLYKNKRQDQSLVASAVRNRYENERSVSPALDRSSEERITPVRVINSLPTSKAFGQPKEAERKVPSAQYRSPKGLTSATSAASAGLPGGNRSTAPQRPVASTVQPPVRDVEEKIQQKTVSAPIALESSFSPSVREENNSPLIFAKRKWFTNAVVTYNDPVISRTDDSADAKSYIFSPKLQLHEKIGFKCIPNPGQKAKVVFGVTTDQLLTVVVDELPTDAAELMMRPGWFVYPHLVTCVGVWDGLVVTRVRSGISLMLPHDPDSEHQIISGIVFSVTVFPFFQFSGCKIEILYDV